MTTTRHQTIIAAALVPILILSVSTEGFAKSKEDGVPFPMKYEGGSLPLNQHDKLTAMVGNSSVVFLQGKQRFEIPYASVTEISYGADVHRRVGEAIGIGALTLGLGAMLLLVKTKKHYVGMTWGPPASTAPTPAAPTALPAVATGQTKNEVSAILGPSVAFVKRSKCPGTKDCYQETFRYSTAEVTFAGTQLDAKGSLLDGKVFEWHSATEQKGGVVFKVGKGDYRGFMTALEGKTGLKAVNTDAQLGTGGTSKP